jgi:hypothetical protein
MHPKKNKKEDCPYTNEMIDELCADFAHLSELWDAAFSLASKINPTPDELTNYKRYVRAAIFSHQAMTLSITHKGHLMWAHVAKAMELPGGLGKKRKDWLEHQHQEGSAIRKQYRTTKNQDVRANAIAGATQRDFNPQVLAKIKEVDKKAEYGPRVDYVKKDEEKRLKREENRIKALEEWEKLNSHIVTATAGDVCQPVAGPLVAHLRAVGDARVYFYQ